MIKKIKHIWYDWKSLSKDQFRNLQVLIFASTLNISFAFEKLFIVIGSPLSDKIWLCVYWFMWLYVTYIALKDYCDDVLEQG